MTRLVWTGTRSERQDAFLRAIDMGMTLKDAGALVGMGPSYSCQYMKDIIKRDYAYPEKEELAAPVPADFTQQAPHMTTNDLARHYGKERKAVLRWAKETGVAPLPYVRPARKPRLKKRAEEPKPTVATLPNGVAPRDMSSVGEAAHFLRRTFSNVYRASVLSAAKLREYGIIGAGHDTYIVGRLGAVPAGRVLEMAEERGYRPAAI